jgi:hypothetical protein
MVAYLILGSSSDAHAGRRIAVVSFGACPAREEVVSALTQAMPEATIVSAADIPGDAEPVVVMSDEGTSYRVVVRRVVRTLVDVSAQCEERARKVAIVAALALEPSELESDASAVAAPPRVTAPPPRATAPRRPGVGVRIEVGGVAERGWVNDIALSPLGGTLRLAIQRDDLSLVIGGTVVRWTFLDKYGFVQRFPIDLALQLRHQSSRVAAAFELGPSLVFQRVSDGHERAVRIEADIRLSARVECWFRPTYGVFAAVTGTYAPNPAQLVKPENGNPLPTMWLGSSAGLILRIR